MTLLLATLLGGCGTPTPTPVPSIPTMDTAVWPPTLPVPVGPPPGWPTDIPPVIHSPSTVRGHAEECAQVLGPIPGFDCLTDADPVPVLVDGIPATSSPETCDAPSLLEGSCNIWSRAGSKQGTHQDGSPRPEVTFVFTCRSEDTEAPTDEGGVYHDVAMIGHNAQTGATCYFQSFPDGRVRWFPSPLTAEETPDLGSTPAEDVWYRPGRTANIACHRCHSADPWIHSPWIDQLADRIEPTDPLVPWTGANDTPYHVVGRAFAGWQLAYFDLPDNPCTTCHRIGTRGCDDFVRYSAGDLSSVPTSSSSTGVQWMPPESPVGEDWETAWRDAVEEIVACCDGQAFGCIQTPTPEGYRYVDPNAPTPLPTPPPTPPPCGVPDADIGSLVGPGVYTAQTCGATADFRNSCGDGPGPDIGVTWTAPTAGTYTFDTLGADYDTVIALHSTCADGDDLLACDDDVGGGDQGSSVTWTLAAGDVVVVSLDGFDADDCGSAVLNITGPPPAP